jgi:putative membrane protein insertion efficiency factor
VVSGRHRYSLLSDMVVNAIIVYQRIISPFLPKTCRFFPTCSAYAIAAIRKYGLWKGGGLSLLRLFRCNPFHPGGYDPVR